MANEKGESLPPGPGIDAQAQSLFFQRLPQEMRDDIYAHLFSSTRFTFGERMTGPFLRVRVRPAAHGLALLRACRRAHLEIGDSWLSRVLFSFEDTRTMLDKLTALPSDTLSKIRHMRVSGDVLMLIYPEDAVYYRLASTLKLLPGLRLDQLTVLGGSGSRVSYDTLSGLIRDGDGWKTLRYICCSSAMLGFRSEWDIDTLWTWPDRARYWRKSQPGHWQSVLERRDGPGLGPSVSVYRAREPARYGSILDPNQRVPYRQKPREGEDSRPDVFPEDAGLMAEDERKKEMLVLVKRGTGVDYQEKEGSPFIDTDIRERMSGMAWPHIRSECIDSLFASDDDDDIPPLRVREKLDPAQVDVYKDVDEYVWTPLHFNPEW